MSSTLEASVFMGNNYSENLHSIKKYRNNLTLKQMFDISEKLTSEQSEEIYGVTPINSEDFSWKHLSLVSTIFGQNHHQVWPNQVWPTPYFSFKSRVRDRVGAPKGRAPKGGAQNFALSFFALPPQFAFFLPFIGGLLVNLSGVFEVPGPSNVHVRSSRVVV